MATTPAPGSSGSSGPSRAWGAAKVIIIGSVMFTFISFWRTAAVVLCDLASTAFYIGGIVEQAIGPAAPWFILAVMVFSYAVRSVYIESCSLFIRGGVYRVVRTALGRVPAKLAVSALVFDYLLTGPISGVSAGQYLVGLGIDSLRLINPNLAIVSDEATRKTIQNWGAVVIAVAITLYFFRQNILGIHESSDKALKIMIATTIMAAIMLVWCGVTIVMQPDKLNPVVLAPDLSAKLEEKKNEKGEVVRDPETNEPILQPRMNKVTGKPEDPMGFLRDTPLAAELRDPKQVNWLSVVGVIGILIAFGHSILAMSGEETLAQVYREVESPKLKNFRRAAFIVFVYSLVLTAGISFLAVLIIPNDIRMAKYSENLISGLAMNVIGPDSLKLFLNAFVVVVGFLILAGAVNTALIGSNGVINRVAEDGVMPDWFLKPHPKYGTTYRILYLIVGLQLLIIFISRGDVLLLGEAYAFGVVWSFVFQALAMVVLRFKDPRPREYKVPFNLRFGSVEIPFGLIFVLLVLLGAAVTNVLTKEVATISGAIFTGLFFTIFLVSEYYRERHRRGGKHEHLEQFNQQAAEEITPATLGLTKFYRKLVSIRSPQNLFMLEKTLAETDPDTTDVVVMTAKVTPVGDNSSTTELDTYDQQLMTAVVQKAEQAGKQVRSLIVPTNNALYAIIRTASNLKVQELVVGASNKYTADEQLEQIGFYWINMNGGEPVPLTVRILGRDRDVLLDLGGGCRIPKISERRARSVAELRAAGVGVDRVLLVHHGEPSSNDLFKAVLTMLDPEVALTLVALSRNGPADKNDLLRQEMDQAKQLGREVQVRHLSGDAGTEIVRLAREEQYDLVILGLPADVPSVAQLPVADWIHYILRNTHCPVFLAATPPVPQETGD